MKKNIIGLIVGIVAITAFFSGCIQSTEVETHENAEYISDVTNLLEFAMSSIKDRSGTITEMDVDARLENTVDRMLNVEITTEFYDKDDNYLGEDNFRIFGLNPKPKPGHSTTFSASLVGIQAKNVDHVKIITTEIVADMP